MQGEEYTTLKELASASGVSKGAIKRRKDMEGLDFQLASVRGGKEKSFQIETLPTKYKTAISKYRRKKQVRSVIAPKITNTQHSWMIRMLGKLLRPIIIEALFGAET